MSVRNDGLEALQAELDDLLARLMALFARAKQRGVNLRFVFPSVAVPVEPARETPSEVQVVPLPEAPPAVPTVPTVPPERPTAPTPSRHAQEIEVLRSYVRGALVKRSGFEELVYLTGVIRDQARLSGVENSTQVTLFSYAVARLRYLKERKLATDKEVASLIGVVGAYAKRTQIGVIHGPKRDDRPWRESWAKDAEEHLRELARRADVDIDPPNPERLIYDLEKLVSNGGLDADISDIVHACLDAGVSSRDPRLVRILRPVLHALDGKRFKDLRAEIREADEKETEVEDTAPDARIPSDWPHFGLTRGKNAVMVGGSPREANRERIQRAFGFKTLEWVETEFRRQSLQRLRDRLSANGPDLLIMLTSFIGHDADEVLLPTCRERGIPFAHVERGYGVVAIRRAIERYVSGR